MRAALYRCAARIALRRYHVAVEECDTRAVALWRRRYERWACRAGLRP